MDQNLRKNNRKKPEITKEESHVFYTSDIYIYLLLPIILNLLSFSYENRKA